MGLVFYQLVKAVLSLSLCDHLPVLEQLAAVFVEDCFIDVAVFAGLAYGKEAALDGWNAEHVRYLEADVNLTVTDDRNGGAVRNGNRLATCCPCWVDAWADRHRGASVNNPGGGRMCVGEERREGVMT